jgi:xanthine dehydrogenase accessory factor
VKLAAIDALAAAAEARRPVAFAKRLSDAAEFVLPDAAAPAALNEAGAAALARNKAGTVTVGDETWFIEARNPPPHLILIGGVHIAQTIVPLAIMTGFAVMLIDPRRGFGNRDRFPGAAISNDWPDEAVRALRPDGHTALVTLTHDPKLDDPALDEALRSEAFYIGALGSRKTHAARLERLASLGHDEAALARIHGPVGLNLGAVSAPEIALSVMAEIVAVRRQGGLVPRK